MHGSALVQRGVRHYTPRNPPGNPINLMNKVQITDQRGVTHNCVWLQASRDQQVRTMGLAFGVKTGGTYFLPESEARGEVASGRAEYSTRSHVGAAVSMTR